MAWFVYDENSTRALENHAEFKRAGVAFAQGNPLLEALERKESVLLLPGTIAEAPFVLHIQNHMVKDDPRKEECLKECLDIMKKEENS